MSSWKVVDQPQSKSKWKLVSESPSDIPQEEMLQPQENESFLQKLGRNLAAGGLEAGRNMANFPYHVQNASRRVGLDVNLFSPGFLNIGGEEVPHIDPNFNYAQALGQKGPGTFMDNLIQGGVSMIPDIAIGGKGIPGLLKRIPAVRGLTASNLKAAEKLIESSKIPVSPHLIEEAIPHLPKSHATKELLKNAAEGDYSNAFGLQSQVGHHARNLANSPLASERLLSPAVQELKQSILKDMDVKLRAKGFNEAADLLKTGINDYRQYMKVKEAIKPYLKKAGLVGGAGGLGFLLLGKLLKGVSTNNED